MTATPQEIATQQEMHNWGDWQRMYYLMSRYIRPYWRGLILLMAVNLSMTALTAILPLIFAPILQIALGEPADVPAPEVGEQAGFFSNFNLSNLGDLMLNWLGLSGSDNPFHSILILSGIYLVVGSLIGLTTFAAYLIALYVRVRAARDLQYDLLTHVLSLSMGFFQGQRTGDLMSRLETDTQQTMYGFEQTVSNLITGPLLVIFYATLLIGTSPILTLVVFVGAVLHYGTTRVIERPIRHFSSAQVSMLAEFSTRLQETLQNIRIVKSFGAERFELQRVKSILRDVVWVNVQYGAYKNGGEPVRRVINTLVEVGILLFAAYELINGRLDVTTFFLFLYIGRSMIQPISLIGNTFTSIHSSLAASERIFTLFGTQPTVVDGTRTVDQLGQRLRLEQVGFAYESDRPVLQEIDLEIWKGETVALVGPSGAGKSTLADLIMHFYDPTEGRITLDGIDLRELDQSQYRQLFGVIPQEALLFNATIAENIAYGRGHITREQIEEAARTANAHDFIMELSQGYDTLVGDRGIRLSGGQRQRVAIARAIVAHPQILVLDEATSALDSESERLIQEAIDRVLERTTAVIIAHRLSTIINADKIVVLKAGRIEAVGPHAELLQTSATYRHLYSLQFQQQNGVTVNGINTAASLDTAHEE